MNNKILFAKKILISFFISTTCISAAMAVIGTIFEPDTRFGYSGFFFPLYWGAVAILPQLLTYSTKELTLKQNIIRKLIHLFLLEGLILLLLYLNGALTSISITISLALSIVMICITVNLVLWVNDTRTAKEFNKALKVFQSNIASK